MKTHIGFKSTLKAALFSTLIGFTACAPHHQAQESYAQDSSSEGIVGGETVVAADSFIKTTVGVAMKGYGVICTGTLISKNLVVTAGHCTMDISSPSDLYITFGKDLKAKTLITRKVLGGRVPAKWAEVNFNAPKDWNDIAVLKIEGEAPAGFEAAVLLSNKAALKDGLDVTIAGFGLLNMVPKKTTDVMQKASIKLTNATFADSELLFAQFEGKGACHGDSGGPALTMIRGRAVLIGVTSRSATLKGGATCLEGSIYTSIAAHIDFLKKAASELNSKSFVAGEAIPQPRD